jgi:hypothetical protein
MMIGYVFYRLAAGVSLVRKRTLNRLTGIMNHSYDILSHCLAAENHPHLQDEPEFIEARNAVEASPELQDQLREAREFFRDHPALIELSTMPRDVKERIAKVLKEEQNSMPAKRGDHVVGPWGVRRNFAWAACLALLLAGMAVMSSWILEEQVDRKHRLALRDMPPQDAFRSEIGRMISQGMPLQTRSENPTELISWLGDQGVSDIQPPKSLLDYPSLGCAYFTAPFGKISVVCFQINNGVVHLFVADAQEMGVEPDHSPRSFILRGRTVLEWSDDEHLYLLIPQEPETDLPELFL